MPDKNNSSILDRHRRYDGADGEQDTNISAQTSQDIRHDWQQSEVVILLGKPLLALIDQARAIHGCYHNHTDIQRASLLSIKTGSCPENCSYCPQSAHFQTFVEKEELMAADQVVDKARAAKDAGAQRFCLGAAWRQIRDGDQFDTVLDMVRGVHDLGLEVCATLGMLNAAQAQRLKEAGLTAYNHNLDTSENFYDQIITSRTYDDRLRTLESVRQAGLSVCCGGIIGMGELIEDRADLLCTLANFTPHPDSVPINTLVPVKGTPLADQKPVDPIDLVRICATARIMMPKARVRLSAGRSRLSAEAQILCFLAGANSIFYGEKLLTTSNQDKDFDHKLLTEIGVNLKPPSNLIG